MAIDADNPPARPPRAALWRPAGLLFLGLCLAGLAVGLWPGLIYPTREAYPAAPLPALKTLSAALVLHALLIYPLVLMRRRAGSVPARASDGKANGAPDGGTTRPARVAVANLGELLMYAVAAGPFFLAAAFLADAVAGDVLRVAVCLAGVYAIGWALGSRVGLTPAGRTAATLAGTVLALGLPAAYYLCLEFAPVSQSSVFFHSLAPLTFVWAQAGSRLPLWPVPLWPVLVYVGLSAAIAVKNRGRYPISWPRK